MQLFLFETRQYIMFFYFTYQPNRNTRENFLKRKYIGSTKVKQKYTACYSKSLYILTLCISWVLRCHELQFPWSSIHHIGHPCALVYVKIFVRTCDKTAFSISAHVTHKRYSLKKKKKKKEGKQFVSIQRQVGLVEFAPDIQNE